jgi:hypothetical protein
MGIGAIYLSSGLEPTSRGGYIMDRATGSSAQ